MHEPQAKVFYDGDCRFCVKSVQLLRRLDWQHTLRFVNSRADKAEISGLPVDSADLLKQMHLESPDGKHLYRGFEAVRWIIWRLPLLAWLAPLLYLPGVPALGQKLYLWIARNRFHLVPCHDGQCTIPGRQRQP
jgi:predicted DCC family thiol-disulfide oxidoreductase YuxK